MRKEKVLIPNIGGNKDVEVLELYVQEGAVVQAEDSILSLESAKAVMDIPTPVGGTVVKLWVKSGDLVSEGDLIAEIGIADTWVEADAEAGSGGSEADGTSAGNSHPVEKTLSVQKSQSGTETVDADSAEPAGTSSGALDDVLNGSAGVPDGILEKQKGAPAEALASASILKRDPDASVEVAQGHFHATPSVRQYARELGVALSRVSGTGPKGRINKGDVKNTVKMVLKKEAEGGFPGVQGQTGMMLPRVPEIDFSKYGPVETIQLTGIQKVSGPHLQASWLNIPHVTHFDETDITELEAFRKKIQNERSGSGVSLSLLVYILKLLPGVLREYPAVNSSLALDGRSLIQKNYFHIGVAVDTPRGLVVPVLRDVDKKGVIQLGGELAMLSKKAREGKLQQEDMEGGTFTVSNLGGIGGTQFTPIVNSPQAAILGLSRAKMVPVYSDGAFVPRLMLPFSLSYDHRIIDGAQGARFCRSLAQLISDPRRSLL